MFMSSHYAKNVLYHHIMYINVNVEEGVTALIN